MSGKTFLKSVAQVVGVLIVFYAGLYALTGLFLRAVEVELAAREQMTLEAMKMARTVGARNAE